MKKTYLLAALGACAMAAAGCGDDTTNNNVDMQAQMVAVSGFTFDIDLLVGILQMNGGPDNPTISAADLFKAAAVPSTPVYALYADGTTKSDTVMADAMGNYTLMVKANSTVNIVADKTTTVLATLTNEDLKVGTSAVSGVPAHVCTSNPYSGPSGVAKAVGIAADALADQGVVMTGTDDHFTPPYVKNTPSMISVDDGSDIYAFSDPTTMPLGFTKGNTSMFGVYGVTKAGSTKHTVKVTATATMGTNTYPVQSCKAYPGYVTFCPISPNP